MTNQNRRTKHGKKAMLLVAVEEDVADRVVEGGAEEASGVVAEVVVGSKPRSCPCLEALLETREHGVLPQPG